MRPEPGRGPWAPARRFVAEHPRAARTREVLTVLARHGLGVVLPAGRRPAGSAARFGQPRAEELRAALEELGPTFIKLGQLLSTRRDLLPASWIDELGKLQDAAPAIDDAVVRAVIEEDLGAAREALFARFDPVPVASASLGQAHAAVLDDGTPVIVKVRKPAVVDLVHVDLEIIQDLADRAARASRFAADLDLPAVAAQFAAALLAELDYVREGRAADHIGAALAGEAGIRIPRVHWSRSSRRVLTLDRLAGVKVDDVAALDAAGVDRRDLVRRAIRAMARMVFVDGVFHADPHPGNLLIAPDGTIGLIDFGMIGRLDERLRERLALLFVAVSRNDADATARALVAVTEPARTVDRSRLRVDVLRFMTLYTGRSLGELRFGTLLLRLTVILRRHRLRLPQDLALLVRMLLLVDAIGERLDPTLDLAGELRPYAARLAAQRFSPRALAARATRAGLDAATLGLELPERLRRLLDTVDTDGIDLHLRADELEPIVARLERVGSRLVAGMVTAALIAGIGELTATRGGRWSARLLDAGLGGIGALGAYLAWTARRGRR